MIVISNKDFAFLLEMLMRPEEREFFKALQKNSNDQGLRNVYHDYLEEHGRMISADFVKNGYTPAELVSGAIADGSYSLMSGYRQPQSLGTRVWTSGRVGG